MVYQLQPTVSTHDLQPTVSAQYLQPTVNPMYSTYRSQESYRQAAATIIEGPANVGALLQGSSYLDRALSDLENFSNFYSIFSDAFGGFVDAVTTPYTSGGITRMRYRLGAGWLNDAVGPARIVIRISKGVQYVNIAINGAEIGGNLIQGNYDAAAEQTYRFAGGTAGAYVGGAIAGAGCVATGVGTVVVAVCAAGGGAVGGFVGDKVGGPVYRGTKAVGTWLGGELYCMGSKNC